MFSSGLVFVVDIVDFSSKSVQMLASTGVRVRMALIESSHHARDIHGERVLAKRRRYRKKLSAA
ncbi:hypothetical protein [Paraburkholderia hiiakae]|uniref:hypothetical protein n=1 Tax=Paraburkholderia hiiakae TaxID=1081782 RepID=UPI001917C36E|nr:hypothetical protein [Paraburkholderia hiiakae]